MIDVEFSEEINDYDYTIIQIRNGDITADNHVFESSDGLLLYAGDPDTDLELWITKDRDVFKTCKSDFKNIRFRPTTRKLRLVVE